MRTLSRCAGLGLWELPGGSGLRIILGCWGRLPLQRVLVQEARHQKLVEGVVPHDAHVHTLPT